MKQLLFSLLMLTCLTLPLAAQDKPRGPNDDELQKSRQQAIAFLRTTQGDDGSWTDSQAIGISALVTYSLLRSNVPADDPMVARALQKIAAASQDDGRICSESSRHSGYETCVALMTLVEANRSGEYTSAIRKAEHFLRDLQYDEGDGVDKSDPRYGGTGYGPGGGRPDLSNTAFLVEALHATGASADDPTLQKALVFISRSQNLASEHNASPVAAKINDGGFHYAVSSHDDAEANADEEALQSYGSMTYAGLKSMIYAGLAPDDPRVVGAVDWIRRHYTVESNPGMGNNGLFYYYQLFAKALSAMQLDVVRDAEGQPHDWRKELAEHLFALQKENGSWVNTSRRWYEGDPNLVTAYSLIALHYCEPPREP